MPGFWNSMWNRFKGNEDKDKHEDKTIKDNAIGSTDYYNMDYNQLAEIFSNGSKSEKNEILKSGVDVIALLKVLDPKEITYVLTESEDKKTILTKLVETPPEELEGFFRKIDDPNIQQEIRKEESRKLTDLINNKSEIETDKSSEFLERTHEVTELEKQKSPAQRADEINRGENELANQGINPKTTPEQYIDRENPDNTIIPENGEMQDAAEAYAELKANEQPNNPFAVVSDGKKYPYATSRDTINKYAPQQELDDRLERKRG